jgi:hypothetical protein
VLGQVAGGEVVTESIYQRIRDDHVRAMLQLRYCPTERSGIRRMLRDRIIERNSPSESVAPRQLSLLLGQLRGAAEVRPRN